MDWTQEQINEIYVKVQKKAMIDANFRKSLLTEPNKAIASITGQQLPDGFKIKVIENDPAYNATFVIPDMIKDELSDEELNQVAGGICKIDRAVCLVESCVAVVSPETK